ncbi:dead end protein 1 [Pseudoliparis swirei]|uniref:dead end protein 1 n=1 Tax=Pseudoliparis swirei TaxID=2059687 RepID=UPI0024BD8F7C|nr:dead end protein 1 [Pseudoliparis swirei]
MDSKQGQVLNLERVQALETWLKATGTKLTQVNGQRKYGGPPEVWLGPTPGARCEVFISQIPRDTYEDRLIPLFSSTGPLWEFRLMMNFSGQNRGFAYAKYDSPAAANESIRLLNGHVMEPNCRLSVRRSTEKRHLCIGDLPAVTKQEELLKVLRGMADGVERMSLKAGPGIEGVSAIVAFSSHHAASMAKKVLVEAFKKQFALNISLKWQSTVKPGVDEQLSPLGRPKSLPPKPPRRCPQPAAPPPRMARPPPAPPGFCRAVGGPAVPQYPPPPGSPRRRVGPTTPAPAALLRELCEAPAALLRELCEANAVGPPLYELCYSHSGPDGFLYFTYKVCISGITTAFKGLVMIFPGPTPTAMLEEARRAAAQQILHRLYTNQLAH